MIHRLPIVAMEFSLLVEEILTQLAIVKPLKFLVFLRLLTPHAVQIVGSLGKSSTKNKIICPKIISLPKRG